MISTTKASEERERRDQGDMRPKKKKSKGVVLVGYLQQKKFKILVGLHKPKSEFIPHQVSRLQSPCKKHGEKGETKTNGGWWEHPQRQSGK